MWVGPASPAKVLCSEACPRLAFLDLPRIQLSSPPLPPAPLPFPPVLQVHLLQKTLHSGQGVKKGGCNSKDALSSVQFSRPVVSDSLRPHELQHARLPVYHQLPEFAQLMSIDSVMPSNHILCRPLLLLPSIFPSIRVFSNESVLPIRWPKHWSFSSSISPSNEYSGLISFRMDWFGLLAVQRILKSLLQHRSSKASIVWCSTFFIVQLSQPYMRML